jgi:AAA domain
MSNTPKPYSDLNALATDFRTTFNPANGKKETEIILLYAYNGTGKTRLSMDFRQAGKKQDEDGNTIARDTLYFNAFTEDLFSWDNDLENDTQRVLKLNRDSQFFAGLRELEMESKISPFLERYSDYNFFIDYDNWTVRFSRKIRKGEETVTEDFIKISRGEENLFIWCFFLAIAQLAIDGQEAYDWVKYIYIDDPISSLDENNTIALANDLTQLLKKEGNTLKTVISTHHILFFNILCNDLKKIKINRYFLHKKGLAGYTLRDTNDTPFFHHVAALSELSHAMESGNIKTFHFNALRSILEKTSSFFGYNNFGKCIDEMEDKVLFERALNLLSHGKYSVYEPVDMVDDTKDLFRRILTAFLDKYKFDLPELLIEETQQSEQL